MLAAGLAADLLAFLLGAGLGPGRGVPGGAAVGAVLGGPGLAGAAAGAAAALAGDWWQTRGWEAAPAIPRPLFTGLLGGALAVLRWAAAGPGPELGVVDGPELRFVGGFLVFAAVVWWTIVPLDGLRPARPA